LHRLRRHRPEQHCNRWLIRKLLISGPKNLSRAYYPPGLPDGLFSNQKSLFAYILEGLIRESVNIFYDHLVYFRAIWNNLWQFGKVCGHLVHFPHFGMFGPRKIWQLCYPHWRTPDIMSPLSDNGAGLGVRLSCRVRSLQSTEFWVSCTLHQGDQMSFWKNRPT
jgi:hypothetical protein